MGDLYKLKGDGIEIHAGNPKTALKLFLARQKLRDRPPLWMGQRALELLLLLETNQTIDRLIILTGRPGRDVKISMRTLVDHKVIDECDGIWFRTDKGDFIATSIDNPVAIYAAA